MLLWLCFAFLTAAIVALLLRPLREAPAEAVAPAEADLAVYRDQLRELDAERDRGLFIDSEIESARAEVARRLLKRAGTKASETAGGEDEAASLARARRIYTAVAAVLPVAGIALYLASGSPHLPDHPFDERKAAEVGESNVAGLIARVEERLREHPDDGKGWDVIAPVYLRLQRYADAAHAFAQANRLEGESVRRLLGFAEATLLAGNGIVSEPVRKAALRVLELEPQRIEVRAWLALAKEQDGDLAGAAIEYRDILAKAPEDASWRSAVSERLDLVEKRIRGEPAGAQQSTPPAQATVPAGEMPDVSTMAPAERDALIARMVDRLATRLKENGRDLDGWIRLARAYKVLGRDDDARGALASAREHFAGEQAPLDEIEKSAASLGIGTEEPARAQ
ncbi:c-type cytochrome biogenesis protein CcmI [Hyphomicrobium sp.]|uniref:c-type cytochrome biogenesis protein CcmI n=1 Tax=Hyphomicrobium sp. TaxID=82 RepID=UPI0025C3C689|nr:c-type cytochrome biogenesis protein CcmI [Hyphomicrobium sp.]MCC7251022.1 c-type cytochrome biogenesis protein CcmI [Hyphomicrobium sp.]